MGVAINYFAVKAMITPSCSFRFEVEHFLLRVWYFTTYLFRLQGLCHHMYVGDSQFLVVWWWQLLIVVSE